MDRIESYSPGSVVNLLLKEIYEKDIEITPSQLQKILYQVCGFISSHVDDPNWSLINRNFQAWGEGYMRGPVCLEVYDAFKGFRNTAITKDFFMEEYFLVNTEKEEVQLLVSQIPKDRVATKHLLKIFLNWFFFDKTEKMNEYLKIGDIPFILTINSKHYPENKWISQPLIHEYFKLMDNLLSYPEIAYN